MSVYLYVYLLCTAVALRGVVRGDQGITITATCSKNHFQRKCWLKSQTPFAFFLQKRDQMDWCINICNHVAQRMEVIWQCDDRG